MTPETLTITLLIVAFAGFAVGILVGLQLAGER